MFADEISCIGTGERSRWPGRTGASPWPKKWHLNCLEQGIMSDWDKGKCLTFVPWKVPSMPNPKRGERMLEQCNRTLPDQSGDKQGIGKDNHHGWLKHSQSIKNPWAHNSHREWRSKQKPCPKSPPLGPRVIASLSSENSVRRGGGRGMKSSCTFPIESIFWVTKYLQLIRKKFFFTE